MNHTGWACRISPMGEVGHSSGFGMAMTWALEVVGMWWYDVRIKLGGWTLFFASLPPFFHSWFAVSFCVFEGQNHGVFVYFSQISGVHRHPFSQRSWGGGHAEAIMGSTGDIPWVLSCWNMLKMVDFSTPREENMRQHWEVHESFLWVARFIFTVRHLWLCVHSNSPWIFGEFDHRSQGCTAPWISVSWAPRFRTPPPSLDLRWVDWTSKDNFCETFLSETMIMTMIFFI